MRQSARRSDGVSAHRFRSVRDNLWRAALGAAVGAVIGALLVGAFNFVMFGFDMSAFIISAGALRYTGPAALLIGVPLYLVIHRVSSGLIGLIITGAIAGVVWAAVSSKGTPDAFLYLAAALLGGFSAIFAYPIVVPRRRARPSEPGR